MKHAIEMSKNALKYSQGEIAARTNLLFVIFMKMKILTLEPFP